MDRRCPRPRPGQLVTGRAWPLVLAIAALTSGGALVFSVFTRVSLALTLMCGAAVVTLLAAWTWARAGPATRTILLDRVQIGLLAGLLATIAYDLTRLVLVEVTNYALWPFDTFPLFGEAILGAQPAPWATLAVGVAYHYLNGIAFGVGYSLLFRSRLFLFGVAWALGLEAAMLLVYPHWIGPVALSREFQVVSLGGHLGYGIALGLLTQYLRDPIRLGGHLGRRI